MLTGICLLMKRLFVLVCIRNSLGNMNFFPVYIILYPKKEVVYRVTYVPSTFRIFKDAIHISISVFLLGCSMQYGSCNSSESVRIIVQTCELFKT